MAAPEVQSEPVNRSNQPVLNIPARILSDVGPPQAAPSWPSCDTDSLQGPHLKSVTYRVLGMDFRPLSRAVAP